MIVTFPEINVEIKTKGSQEENFMQILGVPTSKLPSCIAYNLANGVETLGEFLGATVDAYANGARAYNQDLEDKLNVEFLNALIHGFAPQGLVYGLVLEDKQKIYWAAGQNSIKDGNVICLSESSVLVKSEQPLLKTKEEMNSFLKDGVNYNWKKVAHTIFIPSVKFTEEVWGFSYNPENLLSIRKYGN